MKPIRRASWRDYLDHMIRRERVKVGLDRREDFVEPRSFEDQCTFIGEKWDHLYRASDVFWMLVELDREDFDKLIPAYQRFGHGHLAVDQTQDQRWFSNVANALMPRRTRRPSQGAIEAFL